MTSDIRCLCISHAVLVVKPKSSFDPQARAPEGGTSNLPVHLMKEGDLFPQAAIARECAEISKRVSLGLVIDVIKAKNVLEGIGPETPQKHYKGIRRKETFACAAGPGATTERTDPSIRPVPCFKHHAALAQPMLSLASPRHGRDDRHLVPRL